MRSILVSLLAVAFFAPPASGQEESLQARKDRLLAEPFLTKAPWLTDYDKALAKSKSSGKLIFAYLTRSYSP